MPLPESARTGSCRGARTEKTGNEAMVGRGCVILPSVSGNGSTKLRTKRSERIALDGAAHLAVGEHGHRHVLANVAPHDCRLAFAERIRVHAEVGPKSPCNVVRIEYELLRSERPRRDGRRGYIEVNRHAAQGAA